MTDKPQPLGEGYQPLQKGYQPSPQKPATGDKVQGGYQPATSEGKPQTTNPPPKNP